MMIKTYIKENWLTKNPKRDGLNPTLYLMSFLLITSFIYLHNYFNASLWMSASFDQVFVQKEWWRAWTTLFAHADLAHISGNLFLFFPFSYYLIAYFGYSFFPVFGFLAGGLVNLIVLQTMPGSVSLIGVSGVVNWMGGAWLALSWLVDTRESRGRRILKVIAITIVLFIPDTFRPDVSYLSHFLGYLAGMGSALVYYLIFKKKILAEEVLEEIVEDEDGHDWIQDQIKTYEENYLIDQKISDSLYHQKEL